MLPRRRGRHRPVRPCLWLVLLLVLVPCAVVVCQPGKKLEEARIYGSIHGYAYYFIDILVGSPVPQRQSVILDTGSTILAFPCKNCKNCGNHIDAPFDFSASDTAEWQQCEGGCPCRNERCSYYQGYTEGSSIAGYWFQDYIRIGDVERKNPAVKAYAGCHDAETKLFTTQKASGIVGVAPRRSRDHETIIDALFSDQKGAVDTKVFAICLADQGGILTVGGYNQSLHRNYDNAEEKPTVVWTPMENHLYYSIGIEDADIEGKSLGGRSAWGSVIVDSGTTFTYVPPEIWKGISETFESFCKDPEHCKGVRTHHSDDCWEIEDEKDLDTFPVFRITFKGGGTIHWRAHSYLFPKPPSKKWCLAIDDNRKHDTVLGMSFMVQRDVIFDRTEDRVGFADAACPRYLDKLRPPPPEHKALPLYPKEFYSTSPPGSSDRGQGRNGTISEGGQTLTGEGGDASMDEAALSSKIGIWTAAIVGVSAVLIAMIVIICQSVRTKPVTYETMAEEDDEEEQRLREIQMSNYRGGDYPGDVPIELGEDYDSDEDDFDERERELRQQPAIPMPVRTA
ncbi:unnamed protein product [Vitrella brassicaformis CCMP3155]|uniref:Peptidase A1 domain-containing protein n=1 Tax=Vitrella brassicaformis (strain CCMP3155) TaxID=1169540 RepID=A0A0G4EGM3_VITBC|nr:unnamed protein product [Vitrella brassicaformis CCMP3155]|eukprot:CEL95593.1 unnamed protein product [Vitrella brassicaformis CCMP3155]